MKILESKLHYDVMHTLGPTDLVNEEAGEQILIFLQLKRFVS